MDLKIKVLGIILDDKNNLLLIKENVPKKNKAFWNAIRGTYDNAKETLEEKQCFVSVEKKREQR